VAQQKMASRWIHKYREATKRWHHGGFRNIVKQQKDGIRCKHKYREATKDRHRGEHEKS